MWKSSYIWIFLLTCIGVGSCKDNIPRHDVIEVSVNNYVKCVVSVKVYEKLQEEDLKKVSNIVIEDINPITKRVHVFFFLPEMDINQGAWARVDYEPHANVVYLGRDLKDDSILNNSFEHITDYIGLWVDNSLNGDILIRIREDKQLGFVFEYISSSDPKPSEFPSRLRKGVEGGHTVYYDIESEANEYFVVEANGNLSAYDNDGLIATFNRIK